MNLNKRKLLKRGTVVNSKMLNNLEAMKRSYDKPKSSLRILPEDLS